VFAFYWITETLTTVGYGDYTGTTREELLFTMMLEFVGLTFFSFLMGSISSMLNKKSRFEELVDERLQKLDAWIKKVERANNPKFLPTWLYKSIRQFVHDAFLYDYNMIIEEFHLYQNVPPKMQTELINTIFYEFKRGFFHFFSCTEKGF